MSQAMEEIRRRIRGAKESKSTELDLRFIYFRTVSNKEMDTVVDELCQLEYLNSLDLSDNGLTTLPDSLAKLTNLKELKLYNNKLTTLPDSFANLTNLTSLNLEFNNLTALPDWLANFTNLTSLNLGFNKLTTLPGWFANSTNLTSLDLEFNNLTTLPDWFANFINLTSLNLRNNNLTALPDWLANFINLTSLNLGHNKLTTLPDWFANLTNLTSLDLGFSKLTVLPDWLANFTNLTSLNLAGNNLTVLPDWLVNFTNLTSLNLVGNKLTVLPGWLVNFINLTSLNLRNNKLTTLPGWFANFINLTSLDLGHNKLTTLPDWFANFTNLTSLDLAGNKLTTLPGWFANFTNLTSLDLSDNPLEEPPLEIASQGIESIRNYFRQREEQGVDLIYEAKLLIVGEGGAGKTSLARKIQNPKYKLKKENEAKPEKSTEGIEVIKWHFPFENGKEFCVNIWDFGGQEIYKATHQFFLTKSSLYFLVADNRKEDTDFYYWLSVVELLSDSSPLLIIKNEKQDRKRDINELQLRGEFSNLKDTLATNLETNRGLDEICNTLRQYITNLPHVKKPLPKSWIKVREVLERDDRNYISLDEYFEICQQNGFTRQEDKLQLSSYLHILGVCLHFQDDDLLNQTVILKPKWGTDAVYRVLDNKQVLGNSGKFTKTDLKEIWNEKQYENKRHELLQLMMKFKLCYKVPTKELYIAPQLLPINQPEFDWEETDNLILRYDYDFMPQGIITQFIVAMHEKIAEQKLVWRTGVVIENDNTRAKVIEHYYQGKKGIKINIAGKHKKELLAIVGYELEKIHAVFERLKYRQWVPCNCSTCKQSTEPNSYEYATLRKYVELGRNEIFCTKGNEDVNVIGLIDDITDKSSFLAKEEHLVRRDNQLLEPLFAHQVNIETVYVQSTKDGDFIQPQKVESIETKRTNNSQTAKGESNMLQKKGVNIKELWLVGLFLIVLYGAVIAGVVWIGKTLPFYALIATLIAALLFVPIIAILLLKLLGLISDRVFTELMRITIGQIPLLRDLLPTGKKELEKGEKPD
jgi:internalin A